MAPTHFKLLFSEKLFYYFPKKMYMFQINMMDFFKKIRPLQSLLQSSSSLDPLNYKLFESRKCPDHLSLYEEMLAYIKFNMFIFRRSSQNILEYTNGNCKKPRTAM